MTDEPLVIIGAGIAGVGTVEGARQGGYRGKIILIGDEAHEPYDRPPLSKDVLLRPGREHSIALSPDGALFTDGVDLKLGRAASAIDRHLRVVTLADGERVPYAKLVLATGSRLRTLPALPREMPGVHYLRGLDDALALRSALERARRVVVVGGGVIGLEIAAAATAAGLPVTVIEAQNRVMPRVASPVVSEYFERRHRAQGVEFRFGVTVQEAVSADGGEIQLRLSDGSDLTADVVVVGVGVTPNSALAEACGLRVMQGAVVVDAHGRTNDPAIFAAGEVTLHHNGLTGRHERQETWAHAVAHGQHVGRCIAAPQGEYAEMCSYWSDQYDINLQVVGAPDGDVEVVRGNAESGKFLVFHVSDGIVTGVSAINSVRELRTAKKLIGRPAPADVSVLADSSAPLAP